MLAESAMGLMAANADQVSSTPKYLICYGNNACHETSVYTEENGCVTFGSHKYCGSYSINKEIIL